jgi:hypothetical protein
MGDTAQSRITHYLSMFSKQGILYFFILKLFKLSNRLVILLASLAKRGEGGSFFAQSEKNEPHSPLLWRAKRAIKPFSRKV